MRILLTGATGFIGRRLAFALAHRGHEVLCVVRNPGASADLPGSRVQGDFATDVEPGIWVPRLAGVDAIVNAVGIIREHKEQTFDVIHRRAPIALFTAATRARVRRVVQISALGADRDARSRYHVSKRAADDHLRSLDLDWIVVQPSLVFGEGGKSARLFTTLASLPVLILPARGDYEVQPIHVDDLVEAVVELIHSDAAKRRTVALVGAQSLTFVDFLQTLRQSLGLKRARAIFMPLSIMRAVATVGESIRASLFDRETLAMLLRGNIADPSDTKVLLKREPRPVSEFVRDRPSVRRAAMLGWIMPLLKLSFAVLWIVSGILSLGVYPVASSYAILARVGLNQELAPLALYGGALLDIFLGLAILIAPKRAWVWGAQCIVILIYTVILTLFAPEYWLHPFGPVLKNLPIFVACLLIHELERR